LEHTLGEADVPTVTRSRRIRPRVKLWLEIDKEQAFCSGMCRILKAIDRTGSIKNAAQDVGRSYRFVWGRLKHIEQTFGVSLVDAQVGGATDRRSALTPAGRALVERFTSLEAEVFRTVDAGAGDLREFLRRAKK